MGLFDQLPMPRTNLLDNLGGYKTPDPSPDDSLKDTSGLTQILEDGQAPLFAQAEQKLISRLKRYKKEASEAKKKHTANWDSYPGFYRGTNQWPKDMPSYKVQAVTNLVLNLIEHKTAMMTDAMPMIRVVPTISDAADENARLRANNTAKALQNLITSIWQEHNMVQRLARLLTYAQVFGSVAINTGIDKIRHRGHIDPTIWVMDPRSVYLDPNIYFGEELYRAQYKITESLLPTDMLRESYRAARDKLKPSSSYDLDSENMGPGGLKAKIRELFGYGDSTGHAIDRTWVDEFWFEDYMLDNAGKRLFPKGRHVILADPGVILVDDDNPYNDAADPIDFMDWHMDLNSVWGCGDVELYKSPQEVYNKMNALLIENANLMTNGIWIGDANALLPEQWDELVNAPGLKVKVRPGSTLKRDPAPPLPAGLFNMLETSKNTLDRLGNFGNLMEGNLPDRASGAAVSQSAQLAQAPNRAKSRQVEALLNRAGQKLISRCFQYVKPDRVWTLTNDGGQMMCFQFDKTAYNKDPIKAQADFKFQIVPDTLLGTNKTQRGMTALQLYQMGIIKSRKRVLDAFEYPDREAIEAENKQIEQQEQMQALMMAAQAPQPQPGSGGDPNKPDPRGGSDKGGGRIPGKLPRPDAQMREFQTVKPPATP